MNRASIPLKVFCKSDHREALLEESVGLCDDFAPISESPTAVSSAEFFTPC